jgi:hypothetical protein
LAISFGELVDVGLTRLGPQPLDAEVALLADRHVSLVGLQIAIEHITMPGSALQQQFDPFVGGRRQLEVGTLGRAVGQSVREMRKRSGSPPRRSPRPRDNFDRRNTLSARRAPSRTTRAAI